MKIQNVTIGAWANEEDANWDSALFLFYSFLYKLTFCAESRAGGETGHIHNLHSKLLSCMPVNASAHHTKWPPGKHRHGELGKVGLNYN